MNHNYSESLNSTNLYVKKLQEYDLTQLKFSVQQINEELDLRDSKNNKKYLSFTSTPFIFSSLDYQKLAASCQSLHRIIEKVVDAWYQGDPLLRHFFQVPDYFVPLIYKQHLHWQTYARYDFILNTNGFLQLNEFNSASPGAVITAGMLNRTANHFLSQLDSKFKFQSQDIERPFYFSSMIETLEQEAKIQPATIAILYDNHYMLFELFEFAKQMTKRGREVIVAHISECLYLNHRLIVQGKWISTAINNFFLRGKNMQLDIVGPWQTISNDDSSHPYWALCQAVLENKVLLTHGFGASLIIEDKRFFSLLKTEKFSYLFSEEEKKIINQLIPNTYSNDMLSNGSLFDEVLKNKNKYIYKLALSGGGLGVVFGDSLTSNEWQEHLINTQNNFIIQEKIFPYKFSIIDPSLMELDHNLSYYVAFGQLVGCHARVSEHFIVTAQAKNRSAFCQPVLVEAQHV